MREAVQHLLTRPHVAMEGDDLVLTYDVISILTFAAVPVVALLIGAGCWRFGGWLAKRDTPDRQAPLKARVVACCTFIFAFAMGLLLIPSMMTLQVRITDDRLTQSTGIWSSDSVREFPFEQIKLIREETRPGQFGPELVWVIHWRSGRVERFDPCDLIAGNSEFIAGELRDRGVAFQSQGE